METATVGHTPTPIGAVLSGTMNSPQTYNVQSTRSTDARGKGLLKLRPMLPTDETVASILGRDEVTVAAVLAGYQKVKGRMGWDEYAAKLNDATRDMVADRFKELRRHGFVGPRAHDGKVSCWTVVHPAGKKVKTSLDLCSLCERVCDRQDWRGVFRIRNGREVAKCWE